jgi:hypothetical protein
MQRKDMPKKHFVPLQKRNTSVKGFTIHLSLPYNLHMKSHLAYIIEEGTKIWAITQLN